MHIREVLEIIEEKIHQHMSWVNKDYEADIVKSMFGHEYVSLRVEDQLFTILVTCDGEVPDENDS